MSADTTPQASEQAPKPVEKRDALNDLLPYKSSDLTYNTYLKVPELVSLQEPRSTPAHHDEMLFIIIHQAYELWFKLVLHELEQVLMHMTKQEVLQARHFMHRVVEIMRLLVSQIHILETMAPTDFLAFRDRLRPASGFQSLQFREVEFMAGLKEARYLKFFRNQPELEARLKARMNGPDLREAYYEMLRNMGYDLPTDCSVAHLESHEEDAGRLLKSLVPLYHNRHDQLPLYLLTESLLDFDQYLGLWREHHVRVVSRVIGMRTGTGGSSGIRYLQSTTIKRCFPYLWQVRTEL